MYRGDFDKITQWCILAMMINRYFFGGYQLKWELTMYETA